MALNKEKFIADYNELVTKRDKEVSQAELQATQLANSRNTWSVNQKEEFIAYAKNLEFDNSSQEIVFYEKYIIPDDSNDILEEISDDVSEEVAEDMPKEA